MSKTAIIVVALVLLLFFTKAGSSILSGFGVSPWSSTGSVGIPKRYTPPANPNATQDQVRAWLGVVQQAGSAVTSAGGAVKQLINGTQYGSAAPPVSPNSYGVDYGAGSSFGTSGSSSDNLSGTGNDVFGIGTG